MKVKSIIALLTIIVICSTMLTGCYSAKSLETLAYAVALGIDKGEGNKIRLSIQFAILSDTSSGGNSSQSKKSTVTTVDCSSIDSGISLINTYISKKVNLSHCKAIVISEEIAYEGVSEYIFTLVNNVELRPDCNVIVSRCKASDYLDNSEPTLESVSARYYELTLTSNEYTGYTENITLDEFYSDILSSKTQAHAILGSINTDSTHQYNNIPIYETDSSYKAGQTPIKAETVIENMGIAVFSDDRLVGELTGINSLCHLIIVNKLKNAVLSVPNPFDSDSEINLYIYLTKDTKSSVKLVNGTPFIECDVTLSGEILNLDQNYDFSDDKNLKLLEDYTSSYLERNIASYLYKTSKEFKSDIANFSNDIIDNYPTWDKWIESDWLGNYENSFFSVNVNSEITIGQLFSKI